MIDVVVIRSDLNGFTKGKKYRVIWGDRKADTVCVTSDEDKRLHLQLDVDAIIMSTGNTDTETPDFLDFLFSYGEAVEAVGGDAQRFVNNMGNMTVLDMMKVLAPNGVRFTHEKSHYNRAEEAKKEPKEFEPRYPGHGGIGEAYSNFFKGEREIDLREGSRG